MVRRTHHAFVTVASLFGTACVLVTPLDGITPTLTSAPDAGRPTDARVAMDAAIATGTSVPIDLHRAESDSITSADAGPEPSPDASDEMAAEPAASRPCRNAAARAGCNAYTQCGCDVGQSCTLAEDEQSITCVSTAQIGQAGEWQHCTSTRDCAAGLACPQTKLCSRYCDRDADCESSQRCVPFEHPLSRRVVAGAHTCQTRCDPVTGDPCPAETKCFATFMNSAVQFAVCTSTVGKALLARGESCEIEGSVCAIKHTCSRFGPEICLPSCRTDADCSGEWPHCHVEDRLAAPDDRIGDCFVWPCDSSHLPTTAAWSKLAPVATRSAFQQCQAACGSRPATDPACVREHCSEALNTCLNSAQEACAGTPTGPCRALYVTANCSNAFARIGANGDFKDCMGQHSECMDEAERTCVSDP
jgi:hypothetical protein